MRVTTNIIAIFFMLLFHVNLAFSQTEEAKGLKVGDKVPEQIMKMVNADTKEAPKPTIINFWATWCVPCIKELKLLDSVLDETDDINILSVTYENDQTVESFLERNSDLKSGRLNIISSDTLIKSCFPHSILPHNIWIDAEGFVQHITGGEEMNRQNILSFIREKSLDIESKKDDIEFDPFEPFHLRDSQFVYRSILTERIEGIFSGKTVQTVGHADKQKVTRVFAFNTTLNNMLWLAVNRNKSPRNFYNTMRIETRDSLRFFSPSQAPLTFEKSAYNSRNEWRAKNTHCYELSLPNPVSDTLFYSYMLDDLKRNFNIEVKVVEDSIMCSIITCSDIQISQPKLSDLTFISLNKEGLIAENVSILSLFEYLNEKVKNNLNDIPLDPPFIDRTGGMRISINLRFEQGIPSYEHIKELIEEKYGIRIKHQIDKYKITVIKT